MKFFNYYQSWADLVINFVVVVPLPNFESFWASYLLSPILERSPSLAISQCKFLSFSRATLKLLQFFTKYINANKVRPWT